MTSFFSSVKGGAAGYKGVPRDQANLTRLPSNNQAKTNETKDSNTRDNYPHYGTYK